MSTEKAYGYITKRARSVKIPEARKISHEKAKEIRALEIEGVIYWGRFKTSLSIWKLSLPCSWVCGS